MCGRDFELHILQKKGIWSKSRQASPTKQNVFCIYFENEIEEDINVDWQKMFQYV